VDKPRRTSTALFTINGLITESFFVHCLNRTPDGWSYTATGLNAGLNLSLAMIQENYGVANFVGQNLLPSKF